jgi:predicted aspartyl protease
MGNTYAKVTLTPFGSQVGFTDNFLVDTGATDSMVPATRLRSWGVIPEGSMKYELADGKKVAFEFGLARFNVMGRITSGRVIFGPDNSESLLGVTILESAALRVNPVTKKLEKLTAGLLK